ncbi:MAG: mycofactocin-coupled SDR family oxidoreductase [Ilumatobacteraceae bacterium]
MAKLQGKVAFISGAARGQGRAHAIRLAEEGADIIAFDLCAQLPTVEYPMATTDDLAHTVKLVEDLGRGIVARQADVRDDDAVQAVLREGLDRFGRVDVVVANAGIAATWTSETTDRSNRQAWHDSIDIMLTGVYYTIEAAVPTLLEQQQGGSIVITSSTAGLMGMAHPLQSTSPGTFGYAAAKHGVVGLMRSYARALGPHNIRVNSVHPTGVNTTMVVNTAFDRFVAANVELGNMLQNTLPVQLVEPEDIANAVVWLSTDDARYITGVTLPVDAGFTLR